MEGLIFHIQDLCASGNLGALREQLGLLAPDQAGQLLNPADRAVSSPLEVAARNDQTGVIELLVGAGADPNWRREEEGGALYAAIQEGADGAVRRLLALGVDVNAANQYRDTPLFHAVMWSNEARGSGSGSGGRDAPEYRRVVEALLAHGADVNQPNAAGRTPLLEAVISNNPSYYPDYEIVRLLIEHGAVDTPDASGLTPSRCAAQNHDKQACEILSPASPRHRSHP